MIVINAGRESGPWMWCCKVCVGWCQWGYLGWSWLTPGHTNSSNVLVHIYLLIYHNFSSTSDQIFTLNTYKGERECVYFASMLQLFGGLFITLPVRPVLLYCVCSTYTVHCVVAGAQCIVSQCQHHCTCSTYTVDLVFVRITQRSRAPGATNSTKPNLHNDSPGSTRLGNASYTLSLPQAVWRQTVCNAYHVVLDWAIHVSKEDELSLSESTM